MKISWKWKSLKIAVPKFLCYFGPHKQRCGRGLVEAYVLRLYKVKILQLYMNLFSVVLQKLLLVWKSSFDLKDIILPYM